MKQSLFNKYGYCELAVGTTVYRMGEIDYSTGAFFALHPRWAKGHRLTDDKIIKAYKIKHPIQLLFLISHLNHYGLPIGAISELYATYVASDCNGADDVTIKFENLVSSSKLTQFLMTVEINGWLSSMEDKPPLEVFLVPSALGCIELDKEVDKEQNFINSLRDINVNPHCILLIIQSIILKNRKTF
ncbi:hypothetical protein ACTHGU_01855 [Chitinophagaceae bacterium MMS25-I14]